jgi:TetR/AcrR family transcriptional regulator, transcriptional repressor for nem operon
VASAADLFHRQGVHRTTLAEVAEGAAVPVGNVYYYFKTKDELVAAVVGSMEDQFRAMLAECEREATPATRLKALVDSWVQMRELLVSYGCPVGSLNSELDKFADATDHDAASIMRLLVEWTEGQFRQIDKKDAAGHAEDLIGGLQGAALLTNALRDPDIMTRYARRFDTWIESSSPQARHARTKSSPAGT